MERAKRAKGQGEAFARCVGLGYNPASAAPSAVEGALASTPDSLRPLSSSGRTPLPGEDLTSIHAQASPPDELFGTLRETPFHEWSTLRQQSLSSVAGDFDSVAARVRQTWSDADRRAQLRQALTAAATSCIQAMADLDASPVGDHLDGAERALRAAATLRTADAPDFRTPGA